MAYAVLESSLLSPALLPASVLTAHLLGVDEEAEPDPLAVLDDTFSGASLDPKWELFEGTEGTAEYTVSGGELHCTHEDGFAVGAALWYSTFVGYLLYQEVTGDFDAIATLRTSNGTDSGAMALTQYRVAALMAHDPDRSEERNYVSVGIGAIAEATLRAEWKTTVADESDSGDPVTGDFDSIAWPSGAGQLRILRVGDDFSVCVRATSGDAWTQLGPTFVRADLPETLQVGLCFYSNQATPDAAGHFTSITFTTPSGSVGGSHTHPSRGVAVSSPRVIPTGQSKMASLPGSGVHGQVSQPSQG